MNDWLKLAISHSLLGGGRTWKRHGSIEWKKFSMKGVKKSMREYSVPVSVIQNWIEASNQWAGQDTDTI